MWHHFSNFLIRAAGSAFNAYGTTGLGLLVLTVLVPTIGKIQSNWDEWRKSPKEQRLSLVQFLWQAVRNARKFTVILTVCAWGIALGIVIVRDVYQDHEALVARTSRPKLTPTTSGSDGQKTLPAQNVPAIQPTKKVSPHTVEKQNGSNPQPVSASQSPSVNPQPQIMPPQTQLEKLIAANRNLSKKDRDNLSDDLHAFSDSLKHGETLMYQGNSEGGEINREGANIANDFAARAAKLHDIAKLTKDYAKSFMQLRTDADYFREQTQFVFGDNPDNLGPNTLTNGLESYAFFLEKWGTIENRKDDSVLILLSEPKNSFQQSLNSYSNWNHECEKRVQQMRASLQN